MRSATNQPASAQTGTNDLIVAISYSIERIIYQALAHYSPVNCSQEPKGHEINQHKADLKAEIPSRLEYILETRKISDDEWLAVQKLQDFLRYATADKFNWGYPKMFEMMSDDFAKLHAYVLEIHNPNGTAARPIYYRPESQGGEEGRESSGV